MRLIETALPGVLIIEPKVFGDERGFFMETFRREEYASRGIPADLVQDNLSYSRHGVLRGLHAQHPRAQGKLVQVFRGEVYDVAVDVRRGSPSYGRWVGAHLSGENRRQLWIPPGFAHGFYVTGEEALFAYKCSDYYHPDAEFSIRWDDPEIGIQWPLAGTAPQVSAKDADAPRLKDIPADRLPPYEPT